jgi:putative transposase
MISAPFADFTWRHARRLAAQTGRDDTNETEVARVLDELLTRAATGPQDGTGVDKASARVAARTRVAAAAHRPPPVEESSVEPDEDDEPDALSTSTVVPMGIFDARAEAERWPF